MILTILFRDGTVLCKSWEDSSKNIDEQVWTSSPPANFPTPKGAVEWRLGLGFTKHMWDRSSQFNPKAVLEMLNEGKSVTLAAI